MKIEKKNFFFIFIYCNFVTKKEDNKRRFHINYGVFFVLNWLNCAAIKLLNES